MRRRTWLPTLGICALALTIACGGAGDEGAELERLRQELEEARDELELCRAGGVATADTDGAEQPVELAAAESETDGAQLGAVIEVDLSQTEMTMEGKKMTAAELARAVRAAVAEDPSAKVVVTASPEVEYEKLVEVLDVARVNGVKNMALGDESKTPPRAAP